MPLCVDLFKFFKAATTTAISYTNITGQAPASNAINQLIKCTWWAKKRDRFAFLLVTMHLPFFFIFGTYKLHRATNVTRARLSDAG